MCSGGGRWRKRLNNADPLRKIARPDYVEAWKAHQPGGLPRIYWGDCAVGSVRTQAHRDAAGWASGGCGDSLVGDAFSGGCPWAGDGRGERGDDPLRCWY